MFDKEEFPPQCDNSTFVDKILNIMTHRRKIHENDQASSSVSNINSDSIIGKLIPKFEMIVKKVASSMFNEILTTRLNKQETTIDVSFQVQ